MNCTKTILRSLGTTPISGKTLSEWKGHSRSSRRVPGYSRSSSRNSKFILGIRNLFSEWHLTTWAIRNPQFSEQLPERFPELMGTHMKYFHLPMHSRTEKGAFGKGASRKFVANCAPNLRKIADVSFRASDEGCARLSQTCREFESQFRTILCKYPFSNAPFSKFLTFWPQW